MHTIESKTFEDAIKPLVYFNCFAGMGAFRQPNQSRTAYAFIQLYTVMQNVSRWTTIYFTFRSLSELVNFENTSMMALTMYRTLLCANSSITVMVPFLIWLQRKVLKDCLRHMAILDNTFQTVLGAQNEYKKEYARLIRQVVTIVLVICVLSIYDTLIPLKLELQMNVGAILMFWSVAQAIHEPILVMLLLDVNLRILLGYLRKKFRYINDCLRGLAGKSSASSHGERLFSIFQTVGPKRDGNKIKNNTEAESVENNKCHLLREIRKAHLELCKLSRKMNLVFGAQNLLYVGMSFVMITGLLYTIYSAFSSKNFTSSQLKEIIPSIVWSSAYALKIWMINHSCGSVSIEAEKTGIVIYELLDSRMDIELRKEIREFGLQMLQNPVIFHACGFFTLDYAFVQGVIGSITTYLVILIQMANISEHSASNAAAVIDSVTEITGNSSIQYL